MKQNYHVRFIGAGGGGGIADIVVSEVDLLVINISKTKAKPGFTVKTLLYIWAVIFRATCLTMTL